MLVVFLVFMLHIFKIFVCSHTCISPGALSVSCTCCYGSHSRISIFCPLGLICWGTFWPSLETICSVPSIEIVFNFSVTAGNWQQAPQKRTMLFSPACLPPQAPHSLVFSFLAWSSLEWIPHSGPQRTVVTFTFEQETAQQKCVKSKKAHLILRVIFCHQIFNFSFCELAKIFVPFCA